MAEQMNVGVEERRSARIEEMAKTMKKVVGTNDEPTETDKFKFGRACNWDRKHLKMLGVKFSRNKRWKWSRVLNKAGEYSPEHDRRKNLL